MSWVWLDDGIDEHPKVARAEAAVGDSGLATMVRAIAYSNRNLTDGFVPTTVAAALTRHRKPAAVAQALVAAVLWEPVEGGFLVHDYADYQELREEIEAKRAKGAAKVRRHRDRKRAGNASVTGYTAVSEALPDTSVTPAPAGATRLVGVGSPLLGDESNQQIDARMPDWRVVLDSLSDDPANRRLRETVEILATSRRLYLDVELIGVANSLDANPDGDHKAAAHIAVANAADPAYRTTDAARVLRYAFEELARGRPRAVAGTPAPQSPSRYGRGRPKINETTGEAA